LLQAAGCGESDGDPTTELDPALVSEFELLLEQYSIEVIVQEHLTAARLLPFRCYLKSQGDPAKVKKYNAQCLKRIAKDLELDCEDYENELNKLSSVIFAKAMSTADDGSECARTCRTND